MNFTPEPILLSPLSLLKLWAKGFGIGIKDNEYEINNIHLPYNRYKFLSFEFVTHKLKDTVSAGYLNAISNQIQRSISDLVILLRETSFEGLTVEETKQIINSEMHSALIAKALIAVHKEVGILPPLMSWLIVT